MADAGLDVEIRELAEIFGDQADRAEGFQAPREVAAVSPDVLVDKGFEEVTSRFREVASLDE